MLPEWLAGDQVRVYRQRKASCKFQDGSQHARHRETQQKTMRILGLAHCAQHAGARGVQQRPCALSQGVSQLVATVLGSMAEAHGQVSIHVGG